MIIDFAALCRSIQASVPSNSPSHSQKCHLNYPEFLFSSKHLRESSVTLRSIDTCSLCDIHLIDYVQTIDCR